MDVSLADFKNAVETFLDHRQAKKMPMPKTEGDDLKGMMLYNRHRSQVFILPTIHHFPRTHLQILLPKIGKTILMDESLPARMEVYCASSLTLRHSEELKVMMRGVYGVELEIFDRTQLSKYEEFAELLQYESAVFSGIDETSKSRRHIRDGDINKVSRHSESDHWWELPYIL